MRVWINDSFALGVHQSSTVCCAEMDSAFCFARRSQHSLSSCVPFHSQVFRLVRLSYLVPQNMELSTAQTFRKSEFSSFTTQEHAQQRNCAECVFCAFNEIVLFSTTG